MKEVSEALARRMLNEYQKLKGTKFFEYLMQRYELKRERAKSDWETIESGTLASPLFEKWLRWQGRSQAFKEAQKLPDLICRELEKQLKVNQE